MPAAGLVFLGYPLHPPGKPDRVRDEHLSAIDGADAVPAGHARSVRDARGAGTGDRPAGPLATLHPIEGGGHSFEVRGAKRDPRDVAASLAPIVAAFMREHGGA